MKRIHTAGPSITQKEIDYVTDAVTRCWYDDANAYHERFEPAFAEYLGVPHALAVASGSSARQTAATDNRPVDAVVMAIVDSWEIDGKEQYRKGESD